MAIAFAGVAYLVWALVAGASRVLMGEMIRSTQGLPLPEAARMVSIFFVDAGFVIDLVGLALLTTSLILILLGSRQKLSISWAWVCAMAQSMLAALGGALVAWAVQRPYVEHFSQGVAPASISAPAQLSMITLPILVPVAILIWTTFLIWLLVERSRLNRRGPTLSDGLRTNVYR